MDYDPATVDSFIELADAIEDAFPGVIVQGNEKTGVFDIGLEDGRVISTTVISPSPCHVFDNCTVEDIIDRLRDTGLR